MNARKRGPVPRIALTADESAESLGMGETKFDTEVAPEVRVIRRGRVRLYPVAELERWADENAERVIDRA